MATPFDFNALLQNPAFMFGSQLLGNSRAPNAIGNAYSTVGKLQEMQQQKALQQAQIINMQEERRIAQEQFQRQQAATDMQLKMQQATFDRQQKFIDANPDMFGGMSGGAPAPTPVPASGAAGSSMEFQPRTDTNPVPAMPQQNPVAPIAPFDPNAFSDPAGPNIGNNRQGQFGERSAFGNNRPMLRTGITPQLLDSLAQVESSGNPNAINPQSGAQGMYQFMPDTARQLGINPMDPVQARAGAERYLQTLTQQNGGSLERALAAYGGFKKKDPTAYIQKVLAGAGMEQSQTPQGAAAPGAPIPGEGGMANPGLDTMRKAAALGMVGLPGAAQLSEYGKALQPQTVSGNSYRVNPSNGQSTYYQDPMATARLGMEGQRLSMEQAKQQYEMGGNASHLPQKALDAINTQRFDVANTEIGKSMETYKELPNQFHALERAQADVAALVKNRSTMTPVGYASNVKLMALKAFSNTFGYDAPKDVQNAEDFNAAMAQLWMKAVKQVDQNPTANQQKSIMASFGTLSNDPAALQRILGQTKISFTRQMQRHNKAVAQFQKGVGSPDPFSRYLDTGETTPAGTPVGGTEDGHIYLGGPVNASTSWTQ